MEELSGLISNLGFPIVAVVAVAWFAYSMVQAYRTDIKEANNQHAEEMSKITEALNNNTIALTKLCEHLDADFDN